MKQGGRLFHLSTTGKVRKSIDYSQMAILDSFFQIPSFKHSMKWPWLSLAYFLLRFYSWDRHCQPYWMKTSPKDGIEALSSRPFRNVSRQGRQANVLMWHPEVILPAGNGVWPVFHQSWGDHSCCSRNTSKWPVFVQEGPRSLLYRNHRWWGGLCRYKNYWCMSIILKELTVSKKRSTSVEFTVIQLENIHCCKKTTKARHFTGLKRNEIRVSSRAAVTGFYVGGLSL